MVDFPHIQGPGSPQEPPGKKADRNVDADKFHKEMHKRVEKVSETDPEQHKKRKRQEESEEEEPLEAPATGPTTPPDQVTPFSLEGEKKKVSPMGMQKAGSISPLESAQPTKAPETPPPPFTTAPPPSSSSLMAAPSPDEMEDDSGLLEENAFMETIPTEEEPAAAGYSTPQPPTPQEAPPPSYPQDRTAPTPEEPKEPEKYPTTSKTDQQTSTTTPSSTTTTPPTNPKRAKAAPAITGEPKKPSVGKGEKTETPPIKEEGVSAAELEKMKEAKPEETGGFFEQYVDVEKDKGRKKEIKSKENVEEGMEIETGVTPIAPLTPSDYIEKEKKDEEEVAAMGLGGGPATPETTTPLQPLAAPAPINPYANLHPQVMDVFERMAGVMTVMSMSGVTETSITLDNPKFASSVFFGSQIIIKEYSSAPLAFNIQINASPQALTMVQGNVDDLMAAFQHGNYNFRVNRLETGLTSDRPLFKRKEPPSGGKQDQPGSNQ